jgi:hypothetical protein
MSPFERFHTFMRGWKDGACGRVMNPIVNSGVLLDEYQNGYARGRVDVRVVHIEQMARTGYDPNLLRESPP